MNRSRLVEVIEDKLTHFFQVCCHRNTQFALEFSTAEQ
ncbi:hypothetical protein D030_5337A, partial [Vibrio parahaemolyticus AQ3810]